MKKYFERRSHNVTLAIQISNQDGLGGDIQEARLEGYPGMQCQLQNHIVYAELAMETYASTFIFFIFFFHAVPNPL